MASAAKQAAERPCDRINGTLVTVGSLVYLSLTPQDLDSQPHPDEVPNLVKDWTTRFYNLAGVIPAAPGYIAKGTVKEQVHLSSNLKCGRVRLRGCIFTIAVLSPKQTAQWAHYFDVDESDMDDDQLDTPASNDGAVHVAISWLEKPSRGRKQGILEAAKAWLSPFGTIMNAFQTRDGPIVSLLPTDKPGLIAALRPLSTKLHGHTCQPVVLDDEAARLLKFVEPADSDYDSDLLAVSQRSDIDEFATTSDSAMSSGSTSRKDKKKAYKKRAKARKRSLSGSKADCGSQSVAGTSGQPTKRSALQPANQESAPEETAPVNLTLPSPGPMLPPLTPVNEPTLVGSCPTQASEEVGKDGSPKPRKKPAKKPRWTRVDFSKVDVTIPPSADVVTLLVRPVDPSKQLRELHPLKLAEFLNFTFGPVQALRDIRAGGLAVDLVPATATVEAALATTSILELKVTVSRPLRAAVSAVITGVHPDLTETEILSEISSDIPVSAVKRLAKPGQKSWAVKLVFDGNSVPERVRLFGRTHNTKPYSDRPLRCFRCQRFGHPARVCRSAARCLVCSGDHPAESCPQPQQPKCCNCGGPHPADNAVCPVLAFQAKVITVKQTCNTSFKAARVAVTNAARSYAAALKGPADQPTSKPTSQPTDRAAPRRSNRPDCNEAPRQPARPTASAAIATQTDDGLPVAPPGTTLPPFDKLEALFKAILGILESAETKNSIASATKRVTAVLEGFRRSHERGDKGVPPTPTSLLT